MNKSIKTRLLIIINSTCPLNLLSIIGLSFSRIADKCYDKGMKKTTQKILTVLLTLFIVITFSGCFGPAKDGFTQLIGLLGNNSAESEATDAAHTNIQADFDSFLERQFIEEATADSITLNFSLRYPENYGIDRISPTYGEYSAEAFIENDEELKKLMEELNSFEYSALTEDQQLTYDILKFKLETTLEFEGYDYYGNALSPTIGLQAQLPFILAEYNFYSEADVVDYLELLEIMDAYYQDILTFEREKSENGFFMSDSAADAVIKQCNEFLANKEDNFLIDSFNSRIDEMDISSDKKEEYKKENKDKVLNNVIPAYKNLIDGLEQLKGTGKNDKGLCYYEHGKEYYELISKDKTGSTKSVTEMATALDERISYAFYEIYQVFDEYPEMGEYLEDIDFGSDDPVEIMEYLKEQMAYFYPQGAEVKYTLKYIDPSLEESSSPAFYLIPALDDFSSNIIYINGAKSIADSLYSTMAHEGFPGHLYQSTYYFNKNPNPMRYMLNFGGYTEGWASYVEANAFYYADFPEMQTELAIILRSDHIISLFMHARSDIGVNYEGWSVEELNEFLTSFGIDDLDTAKSMHDRVIQEPANYLNYAIGSLEFFELYEYASSEMGSKFSLIDFHKSILDVGPAPFPIVKEAVDNYINS